MLHLLKKSAPHTLRSSVLALRQSVFSRRLHKTALVNTAMHLHRDPNTLSNYDKFRVTHTSADLSIDFDNKVLKGTVTHTVKSINGTTETAIILDTRFLDVHEVSVNGERSNWELLAQSKPYGHALKVPLNQAIKGGETLSLRIGVQTTKDGTAVQFLTPVQARSQHPYMFSQCQAINARSIFPCQDTPDVKSTFEFNITSPLPVLASGLAVGSPEAASGNKNNEKVYRFRQDIPIPSYLFAVASGDIVSAPIGPRSVVATGPEGIKAAQWEFEEATEPYIESIEKIIYPYQWGTYNLLVLPPSFPYGGMENPVYTYCTPTVVSGDRQNVDVIAHELSHSWSGNLVTAASWEHFWLNEGWTTYLERRLQAAVHGEPHRDFSAIIGWKSLVDAVNGYGTDHNFTKMIPDLKGKDPDDAFSTVPYEKGYTFLSYLEAKVGKEKWNKFIPHYFTTFKCASLDSYEFKTNLIDFFADDSAASTALTSVNWDDWFYKPGLPPKPEFDTSLADVCFKLAAKWKHADPLTFRPDKSDITGWAANQVVVFLDQILEFKEPLSPELADTMGKAYDLTTSTNVEVTARYFQVGLRAKDKNVYQPTADLLGNVGRMKFVRPL